MISMTSQLGGQNSSITSTSWLSAKSLWRCGRGRVYKGLGFRVYKSLGLRVYVNKSQSVSLARLHCLNNYPDLYCISYACLGFNM